MKNDLTCAVVRDLLPAFVEGLTSDETNTAVEAHLSARTVPPAGRPWRPLQSLRKRRSRAGK